MEVVQVIQAMFHVGEDDGFRAGGVTKCIGNTPCLLMHNAKRCPRVAGARFCIGRHAEMLKSGCLAVP